MNQLLAIRCFARVVDTASFTRAAETLGLPKATVSKLVLDLESHLGVRLLQRTTRRVTVTADGTAYYEGTAQLMRQLEEFDQNFTGAHVKPQGKIRVDVAGLPGRTIVLPALPDFFARYPDVQIDLGISDRPVDLIDESVDCVIRGGALMRARVASRLLAVASWSTCATPAYLREHGTPQHPHDLRGDHRIIGYHQVHSGRALPGRFARHGEVIEIDGPYALSVNDGGARLTAGMLGLGVFQTFTYAVREQLAAGTLVEILSDWRPPGYPFQVAYPENRRLSNRVRVFIDWLVEVFDQLNQAERPPSTLSATPLT